MKNKRAIALIVSLICILLIVGCNKGEGRDEVNLDKEKEISLPSNQKGYERMTLEELEEKLLEAVGIELKNTDNESIGLLKEREDILLFVEELFKYTHQEKYSNDAKGNTVVGPINFYFSDDEGLYGIMKRDYIYIEGHYFLLTNKDVERVEKMFIQNVIESPAGGN